MLQFTRLVTPLVSVEPQQTLMDFNWAILSRDLYRNNSDDISEGALPIIAYKGRLRPKGVPFSGFRYTKS